MNIKRISLITGATGYIGSYLSKKLYNSNNTIIRIGNINSNKINSENLILKNINHMTDWSKELKSVTTVFHLAGISENDKFKKINKNTYLEYNYLATINLAKQAIESNVKNFIFLSTASLYPETNKEKIYNEVSKLDIKDDYMKSKYMAENELINLFKSSKYSKLLILRIPSVYGHVKKGSWSKLINLIKTGLPLPFGSINARRSYISIENLTSALTMFSYNNIIRSDIYNICDPEDKSISEIITMISNEMNINIKLFKSNKLISKYIFYLVNKKNIYESIFLNRRISMKKFNEDYKWHTINNFNESIRVLIKNETDEKET